MSDHDLDSYWKVRAEHAEARVKELQEENFRLGMELGHLDMRFGNSFTTETGEAFEEMLLGKLPTDYETMTKRVRELEEKLARTLPPPDVEAQREWIAHLEAEVARLRELLTTWKSALDAKNTAYLAWCEHVYEDTGSGTFATAYDEATVAERAARGALLIEAEKAALDAAKGGTHE